MNAPATNPCLSAKHLVKRFGGLAAVDGVSIDLWRGKIHAVIGPNGAGKSTLTHLLSGDLAPTSGSVMLLGQEIAGASPECVSRAGLGRSYQKTNVFLPFSVFENVRLAAQSRQPRRWQWFKPASHFSQLDAEVARLLALCGLSEKSQALAGAVSHGEQRQLEIAMSLATRPQVLLLDEPLAGMGGSEAERMVALLQSLKGELALLLVEHDMDAVFALADHLTVMVNGAVIASGAPADIRHNAAVQSAYLGHESTL